MHLWYQNTRKEKDHLLSFSVPFLRNSPIGSQLQCHIVIHVSSLEKYLSIDVPSVSLQTVHHPIIRAIFIEHSAIIDDAQPVVVLSLFKHEYHVYQFRILCMVGLYVVFTFLWGDPGDRRESPHIPLY